MDILAHGLWTNVMYKVIPNTKNDSKMTRWGIFFGIFPDIFAFTPIWIYIFYRAIFLGQGLAFIRPEDDAHIPLEQLTHNLYQISHSLVIWVILFGLIWLVIRKIPWVLLGWALHICIDIFSHSNRFFPTPFLWPVSSFHINGWSWAEPVFMIVNYGLLLLLYLLIVPRIKSRTSFSE